MKYKLFFLIAIFIFRGLISNSYAQSENALSFDGIDDYVSLGNTPVLSFDNSNTFTIEAWIKTNNTGYQTIISKMYDSYPWTGFVIYIESGTIRFDLVGTPGQINYLTNTKYNDNLWHHVAVTYNGNSDISGINIYVDGSIQTLVGYNNLLSGSILNSANFNIGKTLPWTSSFSGTIDEVRVWNTVRTDCEIANNMNTRLIGNEAGLIAYYNFNHGVAEGSNPNFDYVDDLTSNQIKGTLYNFALNGTTSNWVNSFANPVISTNAATSITSSSAKLNANIISTGSSNVTIRGFCYSTTSCPSLTDSNINTVGTYSPGEYNFNITGLTPNTTYYYRAFAKNSLGTSYGEVQTFTTLGLPEINITGNSTTIENGDNTASTTNHTDFGNVLVSGNLERTFTIENTGTSDLTVSAITLSGTNSDLFSIGAIVFPLTISSNSSLTFTITYSPLTTGLHSAVVTVINDDSDEGTYDFAIAGTGIAPEINITGNSTSIEDGDNTASTTDHTDFGNVLVSENLERIFTIENTGTSDLTVSSITLSGTNSDLFSISALVFPLTIPSNSSHTFTITYSPLTTGLHSAVVTITNDDSDEGMYDFAIAGTGITPTPVALDATNINSNSFTANWQPVANAISYFFDLSTDINFTTFVSNYNNLNVGNITSYDIAGLNIGTYYYRIRALILSTTTDNSNTIQVTIVSDLPNAPTIQATGIEFSNIKSNEFTANWIRGNGTYNIAFVKQTNTGLALANNTTTYTANTNFTFGSQIDTTQWYCVLNGTENNVTVTGLNPETEYRMMVIEYNGEPSKEVYLIQENSSNPNNVTTNKLATVEDVQNLVTPNNDSFNDTWVIDLDLFRGYKLYIYNNLGDEIYHSDNYDNTWNAVYKGNELPSGIYYYILVNNNDFVKGTITVIR